MPPRANEEVAIRFYDIDRCGYYKYDGAGGSHELCTITEMLDDLIDWSDGLTLEESKTTNLFTTASERLNVYCLSVKKSANNHFLISTWNESHNKDGKIFSISKDEVVSDDPILNSIEVEDGTIPGYATYFWFIPEDNIFATIRFQHVENGHAGLKAYLHGFLTFFSKFTISEVNDEGENEIKGYGNEDTHHNDIHPYFKSKLLRCSGDNANILESFSDITKVIRRVSLMQSVEEDIEIYEKITNFLGLTDTQVMQDVVPIEFIINTHPTETEVEQILENYTHDEQSWDDIGFKFKKQTNIEWLSSKIPKKSLNVSIERYNTELINTQDLLTELDANYRELKSIYADNS